MSNISANVSRLRFMQGSSTLKGQQGDNWSKVFVTEPEWCNLSKEEFNELTKLPKLVETLDKIPMKVMARRSYQGFNPAVERHQKIIRAAKDRCMTESVDAADSQD